MDVGIFYTHSKPTIIHQLIEIKNYVNAMLLTLSPNNINLKKSCCNCYKFSSVLLYSPALRVMANEDHVRETTYLFPFSDSN